MSLDKDSFNQHCRIFPFYVIFPLYIYKYKFLAKSCLNCLNSPSYLLILFNVSIYPIILNNVFFNTIMRVQHNSFSNFSLLNIYVFIITYYYLWYQKSGFMTGILCKRHSCNTSLCTIQDYISWKKFLEVDSPG